MTNIGGPGNIARNVMEVRPPTVVAPSQLPVSTAATTPVSTPSAQSGMPKPKIAASLAAAKDIRGSDIGGFLMIPTTATAKHNCKNFLVKLQQRAEKQPPAVAKNVRNLIQGLINGVLDPETFTTKFQQELNLKPQPCLVPFLKRSLPYLQNSLLSGETDTPKTRG